ncbi:hypothetical protein N5D27_16555 [Stutzerimonas stutzeri]|uniref:Uncharacterized protein n=1 Tax=Aquipseudomonas alcaligenes TaxID=43263 RepID=A0AA42N4N2_AQUAC|nr:MULTISPECIES: hypothetical protein [Pseudomonadaceae]MDH0728113.1 hypothetical protein [Stutzerimonas stutzeri]MDH1057399.1 hypothetical protein [Pseudomonas alcaligenes]
MASSSREIAESIIQNALGIHPLAWEYDNFSVRPVEYLFFAEIYDISLSENDLAVHPEAREFLELFPLDFIETKLSAVANSQDHMDLLMRRAKYYSLLDESPEEERLYLRRSAIYQMHCALMKRDFGDFYDSLSSDCNGLTKEAEEFISARGD